MGRWGSDGKSKKRPGIQGRQMGSNLGSKRLLRVPLKKKSKSSPMVLISSAVLNLNKSQSHWRLKVFKLILGISGRRAYKRILIRISKTLETSQQVSNKLLFKQIPILSKLKIHRINN
jgi:hypothetical protein